MGKVIRAIIIGVLAFVVLTAMFSLYNAVTEEHVTFVGTVSAANNTTSDDVGMGLKLIGAGLAVGLSGIGAGIGEASVGAAAVGAMAEDPKMFGKGLLMTVIPETIVIFGLLVAFMIIGGLSKEVSK